MPLEQIVGLGTGELPIGRQSTYQQGYSQAFARATALGRQGPAIFQGSVARKPPTSNKWFHGPGNPFRAGPGYMPWLQRTIDPQQSTLEQDLFGNALAHIEGLHPGGQGYGAQTLQRMTPFGSPIDINQTLNFDAHLSGKFNPREQYVRESNVAWLKEWVTKLTDPSVNIAAVDFETTGLTGRLELTGEPYKPYGSIVEFGTSTSGGARTRGFTPQADSAELARLAAQEGLPSKVKVMWASQSARLAEHGAGPRSTSIDIVNHLVGLAKPGAKNYLANINLGAFDLKMLGQQYAIDTGKITPEILAQWEAVQKSGVTASIKAFHADIIEPKWIEATEEIRSKLLGAGYEFVELMGGIHGQEGKFHTSMRPEERRRGLVGMYADTTESWWAEQFKKIGLDPEEAVDKARFAARKGSTLKDVIGFLTPAGKKAREYNWHEGLSDADAVIDALSPESLNELVKLMTPGSEAAERQIFEKRIAQQYAALKQYGAKFEESAGGKRITELMLKVLEGYTPPRPLLDTVTAMPWKTKAGLVGAGALVLYAGSQMVLGSDRTIHVPRMQEAYGEQPGGLHPGDKGYATQITRQMTDFGSKWQAAKGLAKHLTDPSWRYAWGALGLGIVAGHLAQSKATGTEVTAMGMGGAYLGAMKGHGIAGLFIGAAAGSTVSLIPHSGLVSGFMIGSATGLGISLKLTGAMRGGLVYQDTMKLFESMMTKEGIPAAEGTAAAFRMLESLGMSPTKGRGMYLDISSMAKTAVTIHNTPALKAFDKPLVGSIGKWYTKNVIEKVPWLSKAMDYHFGSPKLAELADIKGELSKASWGEINKAVWQDYKGGLPISFGIAAIGAGADLLSPSKDEAIPKIQKAYGQQPGALHPGDKGYATQVIRGMTDFGSVYHIMKALERAGIMSRITGPSSTQIAERVVKSVVKEFNAEGMAGIFLDLTVLKGGKSDLSFNRIRNAKARRETKALVALVEDATNIKATANKFSKAIPLVEQLSLGRNGRLPIMAHVEGEALGLVTKAERNKSWTPASLVQHVRDRMIDMSRQTIEIGGALTHAVNKGEFGHILINDNAINSLSNNLQSGFLEHELLHKALKRDRIFFGGELSKKVAQSQTFSLPFFLEAQELQYSKAFMAEEHLALMLSPSSTGMSVKINQKDLAFARHIVAKELWRSRPEVNAARAFERRNRIAQKAYTRRVHRRLTPSPAVTSRLREMPTAGLVNHVLDNPDVHHRHTRFAGKSYDGAV